MKKENLEIPFNLQFFAQDTAKPGAQAELSSEQKPEAEVKEGGAPGNENQEPQNTDPDAKVQELMAEIARMKVEEQRQKKALDKALQEKGEVTKALRAKQTAAELEDEAKREEEERHQAYVMELEEFKRKTEAKERYLMQGMSVEMATKAADAEVSGDMEALTDIQRQHTEATLKAARAEWQKSIPQPNFGTGEYSSMTKKEILAIKDTAERQKAILANRQMFGI